MSLLCTAILEAAFEVSVNGLWIRVLFWYIHHIIYFLESESWSLEYALKRKGGK